ncbi:MAG: head-tail adaptor protein [Sphingomonas sp.]|uniref:head-tail adaptor protein n=1 Tax=Sphingomonas sp. TaxID=28214 RepID=UPI000DBC15FE|nr:head-tail adaptor protein [Sphingomonas sp.]PZU77766.1 MAG: head-tail adaptor protein [Sphingomonas sp.]
MKKGPLNRRVAIFRRAAADDGFSSSPGVPVNIGSRWTEKRDVSDAERFVAASQGLVVTTRFVLKFDSLTSSLKADDQLECEGVRYEVVGIKEVGGRRVGIEITAKAIRS